MYYIRHNITVYQVHRIGCVRKETQSQILHSHMHYIHKQFSEDDKFIHDDIFTQYTSINAIQHFLPTEAEDVPVVITAPLHGNKKCQCDTGSDVSSYCYKKMETLN